SLFGVAAGMALRGYRPILEIMFGDFIALGFDQIVNGISKFREMYDEQVTLPLVVRTPMGGRRGYGPTHSQSLEKFLLGVPNVTYGGMLPIALEAATELIVEEETFCEVVALGRLLPLDLAPVLESVARSGALVTAEEGSLTGGVGAEIAARVQEEAWGELRRPIRRVAAADGIIPAAPGLENARLPGARQIVESVMTLVGARAG